MENNEIGKDRLENNGKEKVLLEPQESHLRRGIDMQNFLEKTEKEKITGAIIGILSNGINQSLLLNGKSGFLSKEGKEKLKKLLSDQGYLDMVPDLLSFLNSISSRNGWDIPDDKPGWNEIIKKFFERKKPFHFYYNMKIAGEILSSKNVSEDLGRRIKNLLGRDPDFNNGVLTDEAIADKINKYIEANKESEKYTPEIKAKKESISKKTRSIQDKYLNNIKFIDGKGYNQYDFNNDSLVNTLIQECKSNEKFEYYLVKYCIKKYTNIVDEDKLNNVLQEVYNITLEEIVKKCNSGNKEDITYIEKLLKQMMRNRLTLLYSNKNAIESGIRTVRSAMGGKIGRIGGSLAADNMPKNPLSKIFGEEGKSEGEMENIEVTKFQKAVADMSLNGLWIMAMKSNKALGNGDVEEEESVELSDIDEKINWMVYNYKLDIYSCLEGKIDNDSDLEFLKDLCMYRSLIFDDVLVMVKKDYDNDSQLGKELLNNFKFIMQKYLEFGEITQNDMYERLKYETDNKDADYLLYAVSIGNIDIDSLEDLEEFKLTVKGEKETKYTSRYNEFKAKMEGEEDEIIMEYVVQSLISRYEAAAAVAEGRNFYESDIIEFTIPITDDQPQSGLKIANNIDNVSAKLNHYGFKSNRTEHEEAALKYTAFDITFKNTFNITNPIIEKLGAQRVNLRDDLFKYGIYNQDNNTFNQGARDKYVAEKLEPIGLTSLDIEELWKTMAGLPAEVEKNYEILSGNFDTDQDNFEKIAKIYALGEIIDNIKNLFENGEVFSDNAKLGNIMGFELDENEPADIVGDCLLLKGKVNGTETKIKYDLRTGKVYMNALTQQEFNPPKITIGNDEPNTEIGNLGNFDDLLEGYQPTSFTQTDKLDYSKSSNENATVDKNGDIIDSNRSNKEGNDAENKDSNKKTLEKLMENKLLKNLAIIGDIVREKAGEQSKENNVIDEFLRTFNILPDEGNSNTIEFLGGSTLYILLESIKNTNDEGYLLKFSKLMSELMSFCGLTRGKNNLSPKESDFDSVTIFNVDEKNATQDIISLQRANQSFFSDGEKDRIKGCECHFDSSVKLSFANIIVQKCCRRYGEGWKISANHAQEFVDSIKKGIEDIKHDENDVVAMENMIEDESMWA